MKLKKSQIQNIIFLVVIVVLLFTPLGTALKVQMNRLLAFAPAVVSKEDQAKLSSYQWSLQSLDGKEFNFTQTNGQVVLLNFWATWCPPCIAEMPSMQELYNDFGDQIAFVFVSQEPKEKIQEFLEKHHYDFPVYHPITTPPNPFHYTSIPQTYLIDKQGNIVIDKNGAANWNSPKVRQTIAELLKQ